MVRRIEDWDEKKSKGKEEEGSSTEAKRKNKSENTSHAKKCVCVEWERYFLCYNHEASRGVRGSRAALLNK